ncbi:hypothetical protein [Leucobacter sp.]
MLRATIRKLETVTHEATGEGLPAIQEQLKAACPQGFELTSAPVSKQTGAVAITALGTYARRDTLDEIEAESMDALRAAVPDGWQLISALRV